MVATTTDLTDRPKTALLVVDVQNGVVDGSYRRNEVVANIRRLVDRARTERVPVVWVQHTDDELVPGTPPWEYGPELNLAETEPLVHKRYGDSFEDTAPDTGHVIPATTWIATILRETAARQRRGRCNARCGRFADWKRR